ncbi:aromatic ring-hydroxylating oxygenase subunit alpha [Henriciella aquimarina]|uniref:aromatic ring-hydroxylating oxygenase subunit alpha n=1 Tax=Henriciella aquimarina TaxID=545261 RepID=UPI000A03BBC3|nr:SRPBCC family protein [Henriciella aquimarina]
MNQIKPVRARNPIKPTLDTLTSSQIEAIRKIPPHDAAPTPELEAHRPVSIFTGEDRFQHEQQRIFLTMPVPITLSTLLEPGTAMAHDGYGVPLLLTRTKEGRLHVFLNACQHKGSKILDGCEVQKQNRLTCPYHAWTYALDGKLVAVARDETFRNFEKHTRNLAELPSREHAGLVWAILDRDADEDWTSLHAQIDEDFTAMGIPSAHVYGRKTFDLKANWKVVLEPFLEGYHVQRLHRNSIGQLFADVPNVTDVFGLSIRQISGKVNFTPDALNDEEENIHKTVTHAYQVFPNCVVVTSPYYISVMLLMPRGPGRTIVDYFMLTPEAPSSEKAEALYSKSYDLILDVFGGEDFWAAEMSQAGLETGALDTVVYSGLEETILTFYDLLESRL